MTDDLRVECWMRICLMPPRETNRYYRVTDLTGRQGVAFLNPNRTWTAIEGTAQPPYDLWDEVR